MNQQRLDFCPQPQRKEAGVNRKLVKTNRKVKKMRVFCLQILFRSSTKCNLP
ncbi:hypothetical protein HOLDEFILI_00550 [Holdemania filiformis DSM 12042]|uniref:Uncharacterized protein n=1 Tax=Holdemania filiformis DSM 12042 TaxID=545696 RepID=B9Y419_9FIRM|nr:hypothetical protein HOLDEFILI_00550 [Holdemania filiformis DSM 12042]